MISPVTSMPPRVRFGNKPHDDHDHGHDHDHHDHGSCNHPDHHHDHGPVKGNGAAGESHEGHNHDQHDHEHASIQPIFNYKGKSKVIKAVAGVVNWFYALFAGFFKDIGELFSGKSKKPPHKHTH